MGRSKPFSGKKKKEQLQAKRASKDEQARKQAEYERMKEEGTLPVPARRMPVKVVEEAFREGTTTRAGTVYKYAKRSLFRKESKLEVEERRRAAQIPYPSRKQSRAVAFKDWWHWGDGSGDTEATVHEPQWISLPCRPAWSNTMSEKQINAQEQKYFTRYLMQLDTLSFQQDSKLNLFERNLEVWRELWRVSEDADVVAMIADARHPLYHLPPSLIRYCTEVVKKPVMIILNKIDLIPETTLQKWTDDLKRWYPGIPILYFSCTPNRGTFFLDDFEGDQQADDEDPNQQSQSNRKKREKLVAQWRRKRDRQVKTAIHYLSTGGAGKDKAEGEHGGSDDDDDDDDDDAHDTISDTSSMYFTSESEEEGCTTSQDERKKKRKRIRREREEHPRVALEDVPDQGERFKGEKKMADAHNKEAREKDAENEKGRTMVREMLKGIKETAVRLGRGDDPRRASNTIRLAMIGSPNVGKSSVINALKGEKSVSVSATAGHTKRLQHIPIDDNLTLIDCPGLIWPVQNLPIYLQTLLGTFSLAQNREPYSVVHFLGYHLPLEIIYHLRSPEDEHEESEWCGYSFCEAYAEKSGFYLNRGKGIPDSYRGGQVLLKEAVSGQLFLYFLPPPESFAPPGVIDSSTIEVEDYSDDAEDASDESDEASNDDDGGDGEEGLTFRDEEDDDEDEGGDGAPPKPLPSAVKKKGDAAAATAQKPPRKTTFAVDEGRPVAPAQTRSLAEEEEEEEERERQRMAAHMSKKEAAKQYKRDKRKGKKDRAPIVYDTPPTLEEELQMLAGGGGGGNDDDGSTRKGNKGDKRKGRNRKGASASASAPVIIEEMVVSGEDDDDEPAAASKAPPKARAAKDRDHLDAAAGQRKPRRARRADSGGDSDSCSASSSSTGEPDSSQRERKGGRKTRRTGNERGSESEDLHEVSEVVRQQHQQQRKKKRSG
eukprot:Rhum_TRINITY_DN14679_c28_g1::Rhum_TRINITY_DN14679_c28_g1_i1::g.110446::m.110446